MHLLVSVSHGKGYWYFSKFTSVLQHTFCVWYTNLWTKHDLRHGFSTALRLVQKTCFLHIAKVTQRGGTMHEEHNQYADCGWWVQEGPINTLQRQLLLSMCRVCCCYNCSELSLACAEWTKVPAALRGYIRTSFTTTARTQPVSHVTKKSVCTHPASTPLLQLLGSTNIIAMLQALKTLHAYALLQTNSSGTLLFAAFVWQRLPRHITRCILFRCHPLVHVGTL